MRQQIKTGFSDSFLVFIALLSSVLTVSAQTDTVITVNLENDAVRRYMSEVHYVSREDTSLVNDYNVAPPRRRDIPTPVVIPMPDVDADTLLLTYADSADFSEGVHALKIARGTKEAEIYNLIPQRTYYYMIMADDRMVSNGEIHTEGQVRMIYVPGANNIRDMGGWPTADGRRIKYGKLFRGTELNGYHYVDSAGLAYMTDELGIQAEIDMRAWYDSAHNVSACGFQASTYGNTDYNPYYYTSDSGQLFEDISIYRSQLRWRWELMFIVNNLKRDRNVYYHCVWGGDRTGYLSLFLEGLLGVDYDGLIKDYELTSFYSGGRTKSRIEPVLDTIMTYEGNTLQEKFNSFFIKTIKSAQADIDFFREAMLEEVKSTDDNGNNGNGDNDNPTTAIRTLRQDEGTEPAAVYDLRGSRIGYTAKRGLVIEIGRDGTARKIIR